MQVTHVPLAIDSFKLSPDGRWLVVSMAVYPDCGTARCTGRARQGKALERTPW